MDKRCIIRALERAQKQKPTGQDAGWQAEGIMISCFQLISQAGGSMDWLDRQPDRRKVLKNIQKVYDRPRGRRVLDDLIEYTISSMLAASWVDDWWVGPLNVNARHLTADQIQALIDSRRRAKREKIIARNNRINQAV